MHNIPVTPYSIEVPYEYMLALRTDEATSCMATIRPASPLV